MDACRVNRKLLRNPVAAIINGDAVPSISLTRCLLTSLSAGLFFLGRAVLFACLAFAAVEGSPCRVSPPGAVVRGNPLALERRCIGCRAHHFRCHRVSQYAAGHRRRDPLPADQTTYSDCASDRAHLSRKSGAWSCCRPACCTCDRAALDNRSVLRPDGHGFQLARLLSPAGCICFYRRHRYR